MIRSQSNTLLNAGKGRGPLETRGNPETSKDGETRPGSGCPLLLPRPGEDKRTHQSAVHTINASDSSGRSTNEGELVLQLPPCAFDAPPPVAFIKVVHPLHPT